MFCQRNCTKTIIRLRLSDYGEYSPQLRLSEYSPIITSLSANNCQIINKICNNLLNNGLHNCVVQLLGNFIQITLVPSTTNIATLYAPCILHAFWLTFLSRLLLTLIPYLFWKQISDWFLAGKYFTAYFFRTCPLFSFLSIKPNWFGVQNPELISCYVAYAAVRLKLLNNNSEQNLAYY